MEIEQTGHKIGVAGCEEAALPHNFNHIIQSIHDKQVISRYKNRGDKNINKHQHLSAEEFIRRFLPHTLPRGFMRVRHYGFLANPHKKKALNVCRVFV